MLISPTIRSRKGKLPFEFRTQLRNTINLPKAMQFWMGYVARELLILGAFFQAAGIMLQVPGACDYRPLYYDDNDDNVGNENEDPANWIADADRETVLDVLGYCLEGLGAYYLMNQVPGGRTDREPQLSGKWKKYIDAQKKYESGLLNIIAECLDELMVRPGIAEVDDPPRATWWQRWWARMDEMR